MLEDKLKDLKKAIDAKRPRCGRRRRSSRRSAELANDADVDITNPEDPKPSRPPTRR
jgi:hypothetical protein